MKELINKILGSLDNKPGNGFSARKLTALLVSVLIVYLHARYVDASNVVEVLTIDSLLLLLLLSVITFEQIIKFKNGTDSNSSSDSTK